MKSEEVKVLSRRLADHGLPFTTKEGVVLAPEDDCGFVLISAVQQLDAGGAPHVLVH